MICVIIFKMEIKNCKVIKNQKIAEKHFILKFENKFSKEFLPGQFLMVALPHFYLRRPFSVFKVNKNTISILYKVVGKGTEILSKMKKGNILNILGPCGNEFNIEQKYENIWIIGGGTGIAPLIFLSEKLKRKNKNITFFYGARNKNLLFFDILPAGIEYVFSTNDGSYGYKGTIFSIVEKMIKKEEKPDVIYCGGPELLLQKVSSLSVRHKIPSFITLENFMGCGMGVCYGCVIKVKEQNGWEYKRVCKDGAIFRGEEVIWQ